jgi:hypothetical protein
MWFNILVCGGAQQSRNNELNLNVCVSILWAMGPKMLIAAVRNEVGKICLQAVLRALTPKRVFHHTFFTHPLYSPECYRRYLCRRICDHVVRVYDSFVFLTFTSLKKVDRSC